MRHIKTYTPHLTPHSSSLSPLSDYNVPENKADVAGADAAAAAASADGGAAAAAAASVRRFSTVKEASEFFTPRWRDK